MRIVLVHPAGSNWFPGKKDVTPVANRMAPLGILSLAAYLEQRGHHVRVVDCLGPFAGSSAEVNVKRIVEMNPDIVGFSTTTSSFPDAVHMARIMKATIPSAVTVAGGVHVSSLGANLLERFEELDFLCIGEGEETLAELADGKAPKSIPGLAFRQDGMAVQNPPRTNLADVDDLPFPAYHLLQGFPKHYNLPLFSYTKTPGATMVTSRGCPFSCSYCDRSVFGRSYRFNSPQYTLDHLRFLNARFGIRHVNIYDDLFTANKNRVLELCELLSFEKMDMEFNCAVRVGQVDRELLSALKSAGCLMVSFGIESGHQPLLDRHKAGVELEQVKETVALAKECGLWVKGLFMIGLPGETEESIRKTGEFALSLDLDDLNYSKFTPFPGAPIWSGIRLHGELLEEWKLMNCLNFVFLPKDIESFTRLEELYREQVNRFYSSPGWRKKMLKKFVKHKDSWWRLLRNMPDFLSAKKAFSPKHNKSAGGYS